MACGLCIDACMTLSVSSHVVWMLLSWLDYEMKIALNSEQENILPHTCEVVCVWTLALWLDYEMKIALNSEQENILPHTCEVACVWTLALIHRKFMSGHLHREGISLPGSTLPFTRCSSGPEPKTCVGATIGVCFFIYVLFATSFPMHMDYEIQRGLALYYWASPRQWGCHFNRRRGQDLTAYVKSNS
jgi:hypothetical protein